MATLWNKNADIPDELSIVFLGNSITTDGTFIAYIDAYLREHMPAKQIHLINLGLSSETVSGLSEQAHPFPRPCLHDRLNKVLNQDKPDWVVMGYGINDGIYAPYSEDRFRSYREGLLKAIALIHAAGAKAIVMTPPPFYADSFQAGQLLQDESGDYSYLTPYAQYNQVMRMYADGVQSLTRDADGVVDIYNALQQHFVQERACNPSYQSGDGIHPNAAGHWVIARTLLDQLFNISLTRTPDYVYDPEKLPSRDMLSIHRSKHSNVRTYDWKGYRRVDFMLEGREGHVIFPKDFAENRPWVWRAEFFDAFAQADMALLAQGWTIAYYNLSNQYGCPGAIERMNQFHNYVTTEYGLMKKAAIFGFSRGGLYAFNYAAAYPEHVMLLYLDAPVLDIRSWPGGKGVGIGAPAEWEQCLAVYGLEDTMEITEMTVSPVDHVHVVAKAKIPILVVAGDADEVVPLAENVGVLEQRYMELGGDITLMVKPGIGHHPHSLEDPQPIVDWILSFKRHI